MRNLIINQIHRFEHAIDDRNTVSSEPIYDGATNTAQPSAMTTLLASGAAPLVEDGQEEDHIGDNSSSQIKWQKKRELTSQHQTLK